MIKEDPMSKMISEKGWAVNHDELYKSGKMAFNNWQSVTRPDFENFRLQGYYEQYLQGKVSCFGCGLGCNDTFIVPGLGGGMAKCAQYQELNTIVGNPDVDLWFEATVLCQKTGIDVCQVAGIIGWLMELHQRGLITEKDTDGIPMEWGSRRAIIDIINKISLREGIGDLLAENYDVIADRFGKGTADYFVHTKGLAIEVYDPRALKGVLLAASVGTRGDYLRGEVPSESTSDFVAMLEKDEAEAFLAEAVAHAKEISGTDKGLIPTEYEGKAALMVHCEDEVSACDMLGFCKHFGYQGSNTLESQFVVDIYNAGKGVSLTHEAFLAATDRTRCLERAFEIREGLTRDDDKLPKRFYEPMPDGKYRGEKADPEKMEKMKTEFYKLRGWDPKTGIPTRKLLEQLGLKDIADDMEKDWSKPNKTHGVDFVSERKNGNISNTKIG